MKIVLAEHAARVGKIRFKLQYCNFRNCHRTYVRKVFFWNSELRRTEQTYYPGIPAYKLRNVTRTSARTAFNPRSWPWANPLHVTAPRGAEGNVFSVTSSRVWSGFPAVSTRIGIHISTWAPLIKRRSDTGIPFTTTEFTTVCSTARHHQERSSCEAKEAAPNGWSFQALPCSLHHQGHSTHPFYISTCPIFQNCGTAQRERHVIQPLLL